MHGVLYHKVHALEHVLLGLQKVRVQNLLDVPQQLLNIWSYVLKASLEYAGYQLGSLDQNCFFLLLEALLDKLQTQRDIHTCLQQHIRHLAYSLYGETVLLFVVSGTDLQHSQETLLAKIEVVRLKQRRVAVGNLTILFDEDRGYVREVFIVLDQVDTVFQKLARTLFDVHVVFLRGVVSNRLVVGIYGRVDHLHELIRVH